MTLKSTKLLSEWTFCKNFYKSVKGSMINNNKNKQKQNIVIFVTEQMEKYKKRKYICFFMFNINNVYQCSGLFSWLNPIVVYSKLTLVSGLYVIHNFMVSHMIQSLMLLSFSVSVNGVLKLYQDLLSNISKRWQMPGQFKILLLC